MKYPAITTLLLSTLFALSGCVRVARVGPQQVIEVKRGTNERVTLEGKVRKLAEPASDMLPTYFFLQLKVPVQIIEKMAPELEASLCEPRAVLERVELWYGGYGVFTELLERDVVLTGKIDCPRGTHVLRDIDYQQQDGGLIRDAVRAAPAHPLP